MRSPYQGALHGGLAWLPEIKPLARVEGELFQVLLVSRLVEKSDAALESVLPVEFAEDAQQE
jgi:hypothetical protein